MTCFANSVNKAVHEPSAGDFLWRFVMEMGFLFVVSLIIVLLITLLPWHIPKELVFVNVLKLVSIGFLAYHTNASAVQINSNDDSFAQGNDKSADVYRYISLYMYFMAALLSVHTLLLIIPSNDKVLDSIHKFANNLIVIDIITVISFLYMPAFWIGNHRFKENNSSNIGAERFASAFIYGVNIPFLVAFAAIMFLSFTSPITTFPTTNPEIFLAGAIAFLIYSSTAASIAVDHYARPFLVESSICQAATSGQK